MEEGGVGQDRKCQKMRPAERSHLRPTLSASRAPHTNTLPPSLTRPAIRQPRASPSGGTQFPDNL